MAQKTDVQLTTEADIIRDETVIGANTALRVGTMFDNLIDSKINNDKISDNTALGNDATLVPSQNAVKTYVDLVTTGLLDDRGNYDASTNLFPSTGGSGTGGTIRKGDLWYISVAGTLGTTPVLIGYSVRALSTNPGQTEANWAISNVGLGYVPEDVSNKSIDVNLGTSDVYYPSQKAVKTYVDAHITTFPYTPENVANKNQDISAAPSSSALYPSNVAVVNYVAAHIPTPTTPSLQDVVAVNPQATSSFGSSNAIGTAISVASTSDSSAVSMEAYTGTGGYVVITNQNDNASEIRATNLTSFRTHQLPDASGILALQSQITNSIQTLKVSFNNTALNGLSTPYTAIAAQGAGKFIRVISVFSNFTWGTTPMTISNPLVAIGYSSVNLLSCSASAVSASGAVFLPNWSFPYNGGISLNYVNQPLEIKSFGTFTGGVANALDIYITYEIITL